MVFGVLMSTSLSANASLLAGPAETIRVYNTLSKQKEPFRTLVPGKVGIYLCGPTVYKEAHIGHMVGPVVFDAIKRYLVYCGYQVKWVVNITDVDDKLIQQSRLRGISMAAVAEENILDYLANLKEFGVDQIDAMPRATEYIAEIIHFIEDLITKGFAYATDGDVFFDVARDPGYGKLSNRSADEQQGEGGGAAARKRSPGDFALWKSAKPDEPAWPSPWGAGRPGWHIECSAMSRALLGETFDIHGGGLDLVFPHHENEIAQSECCHGKPMVKYWMHNGLMRAAAAGKVGGRAEREAQAATGLPAQPETVLSNSLGQPDEPPADVSTKISRSKGAGGLAELIRRQGGERLRFFLLRTHYRSTIVFSEEGIAEAGTGLETFHRFFTRYQRLAGHNFYQLLPVSRRAQSAASGNASHPLLEAIAQHREAFLSRMDDDFNTGGAISVLFDLVRDLNRFLDQHGLDEPARRTPELLQVLEQGVATLREFSAVLGLFLREPVRAHQDDQLVAKLMQLLLAVRAESRSKRDFATADRIRQGLAAIGVTLEDRKDGTDWRIG